MNKAIFIILLGMFVLAQTSAVSLQEEKSEAMTVSESQSKEIESVQHSRQLLTVQPTHEHSVNFTMCYHHCIIEHPSQYCAHCCHYGESVN